MNKSLEEETLDAEVSQDFGSLEKVASFVW